MSANQQHCPFCVNVLIHKDREILTQTPHSAAFFDSYPSTPNHVLVIPKQHVSRLLHLTPTQYHDLWSVARDMLIMLEETNPDAYTIGVNDGVAAGQTIDHAHLHIIPRHTGDVEDPRGGIRWAIAKTAAYWK